MSKNTLWFLLLVPFGFSMITVLFAGKYSVIAPHLTFYYICIIAFLLVSIAGLLAAFRTTADKNKSLFGSVALTITLLKIIVAVVLAIGYVLITTHISSWFILPFFLIYLYFTIYETFALIQIGRHPYD